MANIPIEQATYSRSGEAEPQRLAQSPGFRDEWHGPVEQILLAFGARPVGIACPNAIFAQPLGRGHVLVVHVADLDVSDTTTRPLGFHVIVIPRKAYTLLWHHPFVLAERLPPNWQARGTLPALFWPDTPLAVRTVEEVRDVLRRVKGQPLSEDMPGEEQMRHLEEHSESPALLGGAQVLVDGGKLVFERSGPDTDLLKALWTLLPNSVRGELWPASFAFSNELGFDVVVMPHVRARDFPGYSTEELAADYPDGRYEFSLQRAAEGGDQNELNALFERRSLKQTWRTGVTILVIVSLMAALSHIGLSPQKKSDAPPAPSAPKARLYLAAGLAGQGNNPLNATTLMPLLDQEIWREVTNQPTKTEP